MTGRDLPGVRGQTLLPLKGPKKENKTCLPGAHPICGMTLLVFFNDFLTNRAHGGCCYTLSNRTLL